MIIRIPLPNPKLAKNLFDPLNTVQNAAGIDLLDNISILRPFPQKIRASAIPTAGGATNVNMRNSIRASDGRFYFVGSATIAAATNLVLFRTATLSASPTWTLDYNVAGTPSDALVEFQDGIYFGYGTTLAKWATLSSGSPSATAIASSGGGNALTTGLNLLLNHRPLGLLYFVHNSGRTIGSYDGSTVTLTRFTVPVGERIVSLQSYGQYVLIGVRSEDSGSSSGDGKSKILVWDGSSTSSISQSIIHDMGLGAVRVIRDTAVAICTTMPSAAAVVRLRIYQGTPGGSMRLVEWKDWRDGKGPTGLNDNAVDISMDKLWFGLQMQQDTTDGGIFVYDPMKESMYRARVPEAATTDDIFTSLRMYGTDTAITYQTSGGTKIINHIGSSSTTQTGVYETNAFRLASGNKRGKIKQIRFLHKANPANTGFTVAVKHIGHYDKSIPSADSFTDLLTPQGSGGSTGKTQSTDNATFTNIYNDNKFKKADFAQLRITFDEVTAITSGGSSEIFTDIIVETEEENA